MKRKKWLIMAATGMIATMMLTSPAMAEADSEIDISTTDNFDGFQSGNIYQYTEGPASGTDAVLYPEGDMLPYPIDIQLFSQGELNYLHKTYTVAANYDPTLLVEKDFSQGGYRYRFSEIIQRDSIAGFAAKTAHQSKSVESETDDEAALLALLGDKLPYSDADGYEGELFLMPETLSVRETGSMPYSYTVTAIRKYEGLENKDWGLVPKTTEKNGMTLKLEDIDWQESGSRSVGYSEIPSSYTAIAHYSGIASGTKASGYVATASYSGEVEKETIGKNTYTIVYEGEQIVVPFNFAPLIIAGLIIAGCIVAVVVLWRLRRNVTIYILQQGVPELYAKVRVSPKNPVLDLSKITDVGVRLVFDKRFVKALYDQKVFVIGRFTNYRISITGSLVQELPPQRYADGASESARQDWEQGSDFSGGEAE